MSRKQQVKTGLNQMAKGVSLALGLTKIFRFLSPYLKAVKTNTTVGAGQITQGVKHALGITQEQKHSKYLDTLVSGYPEDQREKYRTIFNNVHVFNEEALQYRPTPYGLSTERYVQLTKHAIDHIGCKDLIGFSTMSGPVSEESFLSMKRVEIEEPVSSESALDNLPPVDHRAQLTLELIHKPVMASGLRLASKLPGAGIGISDQVIDVVGEEIGFEIDRNLLSQINNLASDPSFTQSGRLALDINQAANQIARDTRRGAGNWVVLTPTALLQLQLDPTAPYVQYHQPTTTGILREIGMLNGSIRVFLCALTSIDVLVGYKGGAKFSDTNIDVGMKYCPYVPVMSSGVVVDPETFEPMLRLMTREGIAYNNHAESYYVKFNLQDPVA